MSLYKLAQFISKFIKTKQLGFYFYDNFFNQLYYIMIEKDDRESKNSVESDNKSKKTMIKLYIIYI